MGNRRNRRTRRNESQSPERDENMSETSLLQGNATLTNVSENVNNVFDRNLGSELTEPSQISNEIEIITQRLSEQNSNKKTQIEHQLNSKFDEILEKEQTKTITQQLMKRMLRVHSPVLLTQNPRVSGVNTHQT